MTIWMVTPEELNRGKALGLREALQDLAEHIEIFELVEARQDRPAVHSLDDVLAEEGLNRDDLDGYTD
ncbi:MAG: hypothetical protein AB1512_07620 [Thermodesulfobacteriota bacterium]